MSRVLAALLALGVASASAAPATLTLTGPGVPIAPLAVNGFNASWNMPLVEAVDAVRAVRPTSLRFPGGNVGDENDLTAAALAYMKANLGVAGAGTAATVQTRVFATREGARNRPEDAAQAARDAREAGLGVTLWEIGNEPDLYAKNRGAAEWTPGKYCATFRAQRAAILAVDPGARFAGPAVSKGDGPAADFLRAFVRECGDVVDVLTWHEYPTDGSRPDGEALATAREVTAHLDAFRALLRDPAANPLGHARDVRLGVTEYSLSYRSDRPRHLADGVGALWAAETTLRLAEGGADLAQYFAILAAGGHGLVDLAGVPRPTLYAFTQLASFRGTAWGVTSTDPDLWPHAAADGKLLTVLVTNAATSTRALATPLEGWTLIGGKTFTEQTARDEADFDRLPLATSVDLPGRSLTRLVYKRLP
ncbi:hypothetical protein [Deinococcus pimensis]|uniref:hypothetical protein n=1 Tax=Deinococcus pimensis TaxID=309888 RepID=UPI0004892F34|nr:hypothetical protein [Deinococcus pimensis]